MFHPDLEYLRVSALREPQWRGISFWMHIKSPHGVISLPKEIVFEEQEDGIEQRAIYNPPLFGLSYNNARLLMDDLYASGIRPTNEQDVAGALKATENHLADMKQLVFSDLNHLGVLIADLQNQND